MSVYVRTTVCFLTSSLLDLTNHDLYKAKQSKDLPCFPNSRSVISKYTSYNMKLSNVSLCGVTLCMMIASILLPRANCFVTTSTRSDTANTTTPPNFLPDSASARMQPKCTAASLAGERLWAQKTDDDNAKEESTVTENDHDNDDLSLAAFRKAKQGMQQQDDKQNDDDNDDFDGYALRDVILQKWGASYDVDFQRVDSFGFRKVYLNILPYSLQSSGSRSGRSRRGRPWRHETEYDYLCHLQAVVEILRQYDQLDYVLAQITETNKKPRAGTNPLVAVPIRLDLTPTQVDAILGYRKE